MYGSSAVPIGVGFRRGYYARPDEAGLFPAVLVLPGLGGLTSGEKALARHLARNGLGVVVVELFPGDDALSTYAETSDRDALSMLEEAYEYLQSDDVLWAVRDKVGLVGIDVGGRAALIAAATRPWVGSVAVVSTPLTGDGDREHQVSDYLPSLAVPVLGLYGEADDLIANETIDTAQELNSHGQWLLYEGAGHDFWNEAAAGYDPGAASDFSARVLAFLRSSLPPPVIEDLG